MNITYPSLLRFLTNKTAQTNRLCHLIFQPCLMHLLKTYSIIALYKWIML